MTGSLTQRLGRSLFVVVACPERACRATARATIRLPRRGRSAARTLRLTSVTRAIRPGKANQRKLVVRVPAKSVTTLRQALRARTRIVAKFTITVSHEGGATTHYSREVRIK